jgi:hypothetical protein
MEDNYRPFEGMNFSAKREESEPYEDYKIRLKQNKDMIKLYNSVGRDMFRVMFPQGVSEALKTLTKTPIVEKVKEGGV